MCYFFIFVIPDLPYFERYNSLNFLLVIYLQIVIFIIKTILTKPIGLIYQTPMIIKTILIVVDFGFKRALKIVRFASNLHWQQTSKPSYIY